MISHFKDYLLSLRKTRNLTQNQLAAILDVTEDTVRGIEKARIVRPSTRIVNRLSSYLQQPETVVLRDILFYRDREKYVADESLNSLTLYVASLLKEHIFHFADVNSMDLAYSAITYDRTNPTRYDLCISYPDFCRKTGSTDYYDLIRHIVKIVELYENTVMKKGERTPKTFKSITVLFNKNQKDIAGSFSEQYSLSDLLFRPDLVFVCFDPDPFSMLKQ